MHLEEACLAYVGLLEMVLGRGIGFERRNCKTGRSGYRLQI